MRNILVLNDFSVQSRIGITYASSVMQKMDGHLLILEIPQQHIQNKRDKDHFYNQIAFTRDRQCTILNAHGDFLSEIGRYVDDYAVTLIIMGISRDKNEYTILDFNTYEKLLEKINIPVLITANLNGNIVIQDIGLILSDINDVSIQEVQDVKHLSELLDAKIHLLYVLGNHDPNRLEVIKSLEEIANKNDLTSSTLNIVHNDKLLDGVKSFTNRKNIDIIALSGQNSTWKNKAADVANEVLENQFCSLYWCSHYDG